MRNFIRRFARLALLVPLAAAPLVGCAAQTEPVVTSTTTTTTDRAVTRTVLYPGGRYQLHGDGVGTPYYWVWVPSGGNIVSAPPIPPAIPVSTTIVTSTPIPAGAGQYQLHGNGTTMPYYWVWVPAGVTPPPPPPPAPPRM